jgi:hypothetical protein
MWSKLSSDLLATIALDSAPIPNVRTVPSASANFLKCVLEVVFCDSASITSFASKWRPFQFHLRSGKHRKVGWMGDESHVILGLEFPGEKGSALS